MVRLRNQVQMVSLHREVREGKAKALFPIRQRLAHLREQHLITQGPDTTPHAQRDVERVMR
jgi:hypothetical protein